MTSGVYRYADMDTTLPQGCHRDSSGRIPRFWAAVPDAGPGYRAGMDVRGWMTADLASVRAKLTSGVLRLVPEERWHEQADGGGATISGLVLHLVRHHDLAVNTVIRDHEPLFLAHRTALGLDAHSPAVGLSEQEDRAATAGLPAAALVAYLEAVFDRTADWMAPLGSMVLDHTPPAAARLSRLAGLDHDEVPWLFGMWTDQPLWWLVQWPVIGHGHTHVGEAVSIRNRMGLSPF